MTLYLPINVDLSKPYPMKVMNVPQFNTGRGALVTLTVEGQVVVPDEESMYIYAKKPDGTMVYADCSMDGTQIKVDLGEQMTAVAGVMDVEIQMVDSSGNSITTTIFKINILASNIDYQKITSQDEFLALVSTLAEVNEMKKNGLKGDPGEAATLQIGTVTASDPGSNPVVTNSGTEQNAVLNFILPRGEKGPTGPPIITVDPSAATEEDTGKAADAYYTRQIVGDLTQLQTTDKSSIVAAVNEQNVKILNRYIIHDPIELHELHDGIYIVSITQNTDMFPYRWGNMIVFSSYSYGSCLFISTVGTAHIRIWNKDTKTYYCDWKSLTLV